MPKFVIDEDMPRSTGRILKEDGHPVKDVRDYGLQGAEDEEIYQFAQREQAVLLTADRCFGNITRFPLGKHFGILIVHFPNETSTNEINRQLLKALRGLSDEDFKGNIV